MRDNIYGEQRSPQPFTFDRKVTDVFEDMIQRSVPGYDLTLSMISHLAQHFHQEGSVIYDLGSSLGACLLAAAEGAPEATLIGVDNSPEMITSAKEKLTPLLPSSQLSFIEADLQDYQLTEPASLIILNFTLQFIPLAQRLALLEHCYQTLRPGGALILSEKIVFSDPVIQATQTALHHDFKREQGYSDLEIAQKRDALDNVLVPETSHTHLDRLATAGFDHASPWFQCFSFTSFLGLKS